MQKAFTLLEMLIALALASVLLYGFSGQLFQLNALLKLNIETQAVQSFLRNIQAHTLYHKQNYAIMVAQNAQSWCIAAFHKKTDSNYCDCLDRAQCTQAEYYYYPIFSDSQIYVAKLYPTIFSDMNGVTGNQSEMCLRIQQQQNQTVLKISHGVTYVIPANKRSQCQ